MGHSQWNWVKTLVLVEPDRANPLGNLNPESLKIVNGHFRIRNAWFNELQSLHKIFYYNMQMDINQMFLKFGFLFSTNAFSPSAGPSLLKRAWKIDVSCYSPCSKVVSIANLIDLLAASSEHEALLTKTSTNLFSSASKLVWEIKWAMLSLWAYSAEIEDPVRIICIAFFVPTILVRNWVPPMPGINPRVISGSPKAADGDATMMSERRAS